MTRLIALKKDINKVPNYINHLSLVDLKVAFHNHCVSAHISRDMIHTKKHWELFWKELSTKCNVMMIRDDKNAK